VLRKRHLQEDYTCVWEHCNTRGIASGYTWEERRAVSVVLRTTVKKIHYSRTTYLEALRCVQWTVWTYSGRVLWAVSYTTSECPAVLRIKDTHLDVSAMYGPMRLVTAEKSAVRYQRYTVRLSSCYRERELHTWKHSQCMQRTAWIPSGRVLYGVSYASNDCTAVEVMSDYIPGSICITHSGPSGYGRVECRGMSAMQQASVQLC